MKTAISIPDQIFIAADQYAKAHGLSRSNLYARAVSMFLEQQPENYITDQLNKIYEKDTSHLNSHVSAIQFNSIEEEW